jgi:hypothetical protein
MTPKNEPAWSTFHRRIVRRPTSAALVSVVMHIVLGVLAWNALQMPGMFDQLVQRDHQARPVTEKVDYLAISPPRAESAFAPAPARRPRPSSQQSAPPAAVPLVAPTEVPTSLPAPPVSADTTRVVTGPLRGGSGRTRGVQPNYDDPRVWTSDPTFYYAPKTAEEKLDSALLATLMRHMDSVATNAYSPNKFERGDWTVEKGGQKYGIDQQYIHIGRFRIPSAILALLPTPYMQANPITMDRDRNMAYMRNDILYHANAQMNEEQFRKAVQGIRDRKDRERRNPRVSPNSVGPLTSPGERPPQK